MPVTIKPTISCILLLMLFGIRPLFARRAVGVAGFPSESQSQRYCAIGEIPHGPINGWNTSFMMSHVPQPNSTIEVYRNGILLEDFTDYQVSSNIITLSPSQVPQVGDTLYVSYLGDTDAAVRSASIPPKSSQTQYPDEISIAESREALRKEANSDYTADDRLSNSRRIRRSHTVGRFPHTEPEALTLLGIRMADEDSGIAKGVEGLGDVAAPSVYSTLPAGEFSRHEDQRSALTMTTPIHEYGRPGIYPSEERPMPAIEMLKGRLAGDQRELGGIESSFEGSPLSAPQKKDHLDLSLRHRFSPAIRRSSDRAINMLARRVGIDSQLNTIGADDNDQQ